MPRYYFSESKGQVLDMNEMHPGHLINALNKTAREALTEAEPFRSEKIQLLGELAVTLVQKGLVLEARPKDN